MDNNVLKCCFTGYRPAKFPFEFSTADSRYIDFENDLLDFIMKVVKEGCYTFYTGMAMGFDIIAAECVLLLKRAHSDLNIKLVCVVPFESQWESYNDYWKEKYFDILEESDEKIILSDSYYTGCYQVRNEYMVDNCDFVLTWYDGKSGGTRNTLNYATKKRRQVFNVNKKGSETFELPQFVQTA